MVHPGGASAGREGRELSFVMLGSICIADGLPLVVRPSSREGKLLRNWNRPAFFLSSAVDRFLVRVIAVRRGHVEHRGQIEEGNMMGKPEVVVVTGASAGVGRAVARAFGERGCSVGLLARGRDGLDAAAKDVEAAGGRALAVPTDVADADQVEAAAVLVEEHLGPIDAWVNNAMTSVFALFAEVTPDEFRRVTDVTYHGYVNGTRSALRRMVPRNRGTIVQVGSALAYRGIPAQSAYCGAKHAIQGFTESVRCELLYEGSRVEIGMVQLPAVNTPQFDWVLSRLPRRAQPVPPIYQPELIARAVVHMAEHPRREMWLTGTTIKAIVGNMLAPGYLDRRLGRTGVSSQQTSEPRDPDRPSNLWEPVPGDFGARGAFDDRARSRDPFVWASLHRRAITISGLTTTAGLAVAGLLGRGVTVRSHLRPGGGTIGGAGRRSESDREEVARWRMWSWPASATASGPRRR